MHTKNEAEYILIEYLRSATPLKRDEYVIRGHCTICKGYGWIIFCNSKKQYEGEEDMAISVKYPYIIDKHTGSICQIRSINVKEAVKEFEDRYVDDDQIDIDILRIEQRYSDNKFVLA
jgi:hypothetical protein